MKQALKSLEEEVNRINLKFLELTAEKKATQLFVVLGVLLVGLGLFCLRFLFLNSIPSISLFFLGFLSTELIVIGYSLMHKSLRGAWL